MRITQFLTAFTIALAIGMQAGVSARDLVVGAQTAGSKHAQHRYHKRAGSSHKAGNKAKGRAPKQQTAVGRRAPATKPRQATRASGSLGFNNPTSQTVSPETEAAFQVARNRQDEARALVAAGRENDALALLNAAKSEFEAMSPGGAGFYDPVAVDAYIFLHRDNDAFALLLRLGNLKGWWDGTIPREGLLLARNGRFWESLSLDPATCALKYWAGYGQDAVNALPNVGTRSGLVAAWCLAIADDEDIAYHKSIAERYYKMGLGAAPGNPLLNLSYGVFVRSQNHLAEAIPYIETAARQVTGMLKACAETLLREIRATLAQRKAAASK